AASSGTSDGISATARQLYAVRSMLQGCGAVASQTWASRGKLRLAGTTPTISYATPSMRSVRPSADAPAPKLRCANDKLTTAPRRASFGSNVRPNTGATPKIGKKFVV